MRSNAAARTQREVKKWRVRPLQNRSAAGFRPPRAAKFAIAALDARPVAFDYPRMVGHVGGNAMGKSIAIAVVSCLAALVGVDQTALAQAGSTGGKQ